MRYQERRDGYKRSGPTVSLIAVQFYDRKVFVWAVDYIYGSISSDIAFLRFARPSWWGDGPGQVKPKYARLNLNPPAIGDKVRVFGFPDSELVDGILNVFPAECECLVTKVDVRTESPTWFKPLAHIELQGEIEHGMSGGPCFDKDWNVIGVNSLSWSGFQSAKVALLWPAMKIEIDPFKTGAFPAIDLFQSGGATALGYRRVYVTSKGEARFSRADPEALKPVGCWARIEDISKTVDFSAAGAQEALAELKAILANAQTGAESFDTNRVIRLCRFCFWELESAIRQAILLAARRTGLAAPSSTTWENLVQMWKEKKPRGEVLDEIAALDFAWNAIDLFELRTYADFARSGVLYTQCTVSVKDETGNGSVIGASLEPPCRQGGQQLFLPDGLDQFFEASKRFVQRVLRLSETSDLALVPRDN